MALPQTNVPQFAPVPQHSGLPESAVRLSTRSLSVHFGERSALDDVSVQFRAGETTSLVGPNGAGKSTLLKCLAGMLAPTHGEVLLDQQPLRRPSSQIAYVPQRSAVDWAFPISVLDVVLMGRALHRNRLSRLSFADREAAFAALDQVRMRRFANVQIGALSGGQQQRVFLARALVQDAQIYLLDEPFTGIDVPTQALVIEVLTSLCQQGKTVVFATHDLAMAAESADACILLRHHVIAAGPPRQVLTAANLQETFGGAAILPFAVSDNP